MKNLKRVGVFALCFLFLFATAGAAAKKDTLNFGVPSWPGVTVKSEVLAQLLEAMGHDVKQITAAPSFIFSSLSANDMQIFLGGWSPLEDPMIDPLVAKKKIIKAGKNIEGAVTALAVPRYVAEAGIEYVEDLDEHKDKFGGIIYSIEPGTGISEDLNAAVDIDAGGLGDWDLKETSTAIMLAEAKSMFDQQKWVVFFGWEPHWMNIAMDLSFLKSKTDGTSDIGSSESIVYTITSAALPESHPEVFTFMQQLRVPNLEQSAWIYEYQHEDRKPKDVAAEWIAANLDGLVAEWTRGVKATDGREAIEAIRAAFQ